MGDAKMEEQNRAFMSNFPNYPKVLSIAGSDSGGGAGIQADLKTFSALGCYGMTAITAVTAQNTQGVQAIHTVPPLIISQQIQSVLSDIGTDAIKIGMLPDEDSIYAVQQSLQIHSEAWNWMVLDPVMVASSGDALMDESARQFLIDRLFPMASIITPNIPEAEFILNRRIYGLGDMKNAAKDLLALGPRSVFIKGGHLAISPLSDVYYHSSLLTPISFTHVKVETQNVHGTGCTLSSAIAAHLALGLPMQAAVAQSYEFLQAALGSGKEVITGKGKGPVNHGFQPRKMKIRFSK